MYRVRIDRTPPLEWGVYIGEICHNLRAALDGLVYQLALANGANTDTHDTEFPIFLFRYTRTVGNRSTDGFFNPKNSKKPESGPGARKIQQLQARHQAIIRRLQPFSRGRGGGASALWLLHEINNADKHRLILATGMKLGSLSYGSWGEEDLSNQVTWDRFKIVKDGAKVGEAAEGVEVHPESIELVAFSEGCPAVSHRAAHLTLRLILEEVSRVVECFAPEFSEALPTAHRRPVVADVPVVGELT